MNYSVGYLRRGMEFTVMCNETRRIVSTHKSRDEALDAINMLTSTVISVKQLAAELGGWRVLVNGETVVRFIGRDAESRAMGYAMALSDNREVQQG